MKYGKSVIIMFLPWFIARNMIFDYRKKREIKRADIRHEKEGRKIIVVQINRHFVSGTREELRRQNKRSASIVKRAFHTHMLDYDYRNSIVYTAGE